MCATLARALCGALLLLVGGPEQDSLPVTETRAGDASLVQSFTGQFNSPTRRIYRVTAYCDRGTTASGVPSGVGQCAAPADIPFGSEIYVPELGRTFLVTDRTHERFRHNTVDIFIPERERCLLFGRRFLDCEVRTPVDPPAYAAPEIFVAATRFAAAFDTPLLPQH